MAQHHYSKQQRIVILSYVLCYLKKIYLQENNRDNWDRCFPLFNTAQNGHADVCTILIKNKGNVNVKIKNGAITLFQRVQNGHVHISTVLLKTTQM